MHCRWPVGSQTHELEQPPGDVEPPPQPELGWHDAPCVQPTGVGRGRGGGLAGGQISVTHCPF